jgi:hypothetical protein
MLFIVFCIRTSIIYKLLLINQLTCVSR